MNEVYEDVTNCLSEASLASTSLMRKRKLHKRLEHKYVIHRSRLIPLLRVLQEEFLIVPSLQKNIASYQTQYFDTRDHMCIREHRRGARPRFKIRIRHYLDRSISMLECKKKLPSGITKKYRLPIPFQCRDISSYEDFLTNHLPDAYKNLYPSIQNTLYRITMLHSSREERLTIDFGICFYNDKRRHMFDECIIVELKRKRQGTRTQTHRILQKNRLYPLSISKYCLGNFFVQPELNMNFYRPKIRLLRKIIYDRAL